MVWLIVLEASPCLYIYLMMDGHKHHAVAVGEWCFSIVSICFDLDSMVFIAYLKQKTVKLAPMDYVVVCHNYHVPISVYTVTFNTKQTVLFSSPGLVYTEHV